MKRISADSFSQRHHFDDHILLRNSGNDKGMGAYRQHNPRTDCRTDDAQIHAGNIETDIPRQIKTVAINLLDSASVLKVFIIPAVLPFGLGDPFNTSIFIIFPVLL